PQRWGIDAAPTTRRRAQALDPIDRRPGITHAEPRVMGGNTRPPGMADDMSEGTPITTEALEAYLAGVLGERVRVTALRPLGTAAEVDFKGFGYGVPLEVECVSGGRTRSLVVARERPAPGFGHEYPADRAWQALYAHEAYNRFPRHARSVDVGFV